MAICILLMVLAGGAAFAAEAEADRWYEVEILLFAIDDPTPPGQPVPDRHAGEEGGDGGEAEEGIERWPEDPGRPDTRQAIELAPPPVAEAGIAPQIEDRADAALAEAASGAGGGEPNAQEASEQTLVVPYRLLPPQQLRLKAEHDRLARSERFTPLLHIAWRQPAFPRNTPGTAVHIRWQAPSEQDQGPDPNQGPNQAVGHAAMEVDPSLALPPTTLEAEAEAGVLGGESISAGSGLEAGPQDGANHGGPGFEPLQQGELFGGSPERRPASVDGLLTVSANRYLHLYLDLLYDTGAMPETGGGGLFGIFRDAAPRAAPARFRMQQRRRLRSGELHYFDHPRLGMLALVTPFTYPVEEVASEAVDAGRQ